MLISFNDVIKLGEEYEKANPKLFAQNIERGSGDDIAFIYYTSGTTGTAQGRQDVQPGADQHRPGVYCPLPDRT